MRASADELSQAAIEMARVAPFGLLQLCMCVLFTCTPESDEDGSRGREMMRRLGGVVGDVLAE